MERKIQVPFDAGDAKASVDAVCAAVKAMNDADYRLKSREYGKDEQGTDVVILIFER